MADRRPTITNPHDHALRQLDALMQGCAEACHDDAEFNVTKGGVNSSEAKKVLDNVAAIFEVRSVDDYLNDLYTDEDEPDTSKGDTT